MTDGSGVNDTSGISAKMVDGIGDDTGVQAGQPSAPPSPYDYGPAPADVHNHGGCADCKKQISILRGALIIIALIVGLLAMIYLAQRRNHKHGNEEPTTPDE